MDEQFIKRNLSDYLSSTEASKQFGVTNDYIARLCRQGKLEGILEGNGWLVKKSSLEQFFISGRNLPTAGDTVISSREAARLYRVTNDYISRLSRQGKLKGALEGRNWLVSTASLKEFFGEIKSVPVPQEPAAPTRAYYIEKMPEPPAPLLPVASKKIRTRTLRMPPSLGLALAAFVIAFGAYAMVGHSLNEGANLAAVGSGNFLGIPSALHSLYDGVHDLFFGASQLATEPPQSPITVTPPPPQTAAATSTQTIVQNNTYPIRERTVVETQSGVTSEILQAQLSQLASSLHQEIYNAVHTPPPVITFTGNTIPPSNTSNTTSGTLTITDADVPDTITASNYVPLAGGAVTGDLSVAGLTTLAYASSTALSITGTASTTDLIISSLGSLGTTCVQADNTGKLSSTGSACGSGGGGGSFPFIPASFGSTASNATSTLLGFNGGLYALASSTVGDGTQTGGLTVNGGATTTGNSYLGGTLRTGGPAAIGGDLDIGAHQLTFGNWTLNNANYPGSGGFVYTSGGDLTFGFSSSGFGPSSQASLQIDGAFIQAEGDKTNTYAGPSQFNSAIGVTGLTTLSDFTGINATTTNATTTSLAISNISSGNLLKTIAGGAIIAAVAGTDYLTSANVPAFPFTPATFGSNNVNATGTLIGFTNGIYSLASSTIGDGTQTGGLTISGGATTTGNALFNLGAIASSTFVVGANGYSNPALQIYASSTNAATGLGIVSNYAGNGVTLQALSSGLTESLTLKTKGNGAAVALSDSGITTTLQAGGGTRLVAGTVGVALSAGPRNSNTATDFTFTGATDVALSASTEAFFAQFNYNQTHTHQNGALSLQRDTIFQAGTHAFSSFNGGANNITDAATLSVTSAPLTGTNATTTNAYAILIGSSTPSTLYNASTTNSYGLAVFTSAGAQNTYAATFNGGNVGVGTTSPFARLSVQASNGSIGKTLFAIGSSTTSATSTLFSISNTGSTTLFQLSSSLLKADENGAIVAAVAGIDYLTSANVAAFPFTPISFGSSAANSTSTLIGFINGIYSLASSTIGSGAAGGGLTISGGATTTGSAYFAANVGIGTTTPGTLLSIGDTGGINFTLATSTFSTTGGISISSGCFAIANTCLSSSPSLTGSTGQVAYFSSTNSAGGTSSLFISPQGNVGVGTTSVSGAALVVSNALSNLGGLLIQTWTNVTNAFTIKNSSGATVFNVDNTQASASLGVGTTTPLSTLVAAGNATIGVDYNIAAPLNGLLVQGSIGVGTTTPASVFTVSGNASIGADYGGAAPANGLFVEGNVAIGTTTPWGQLTVDGTLVSSPVTTPQLTLKSVAGQTASALAIYNSAGTVQFSVGATGIVNVAGSITTQGIRSQAAIASGVNAALFLAVGSTATQNQFQSILPANATGLSLSSLTSIQLGQFSVNGNGNWNIGTTSTTSNIVFSIQAPPTSGNVSGYGAQNALFDVASTTSTTYATSSLFRINATGKVGVGTTSPLAKLSVDTSNLLSGSQSFVVGSTTRTDFIITQAGYAGINSVNPQNFLSISTSTNLGTISLEFNGASAFAGGFNNSDTGSSGQTTFNFLRNNTSVGSINTTNVATAYNTSSDRRVKENIATTSLGLDTLMQLPVRDFDFIKDPAHKLTTGFIAQELYNVFPEAVSTNGDDGTVALSSTSTPWSVDYGRITPLIVKAVQDLNAKVEDLATSTQPAAGSFAQRFFASLTQRLTGWLADSANGIGDIFAQTITITTVNADTVNAKTLCLEDVCVTKSQLQALLSAQNISEEPSAPEPSEESGEGSSTSQEVTPPDKAPQPDVTVSEGSPPVIDDAQ